MYYRFNPECLSRGLCSNAKLNSHRLYPDNKEVNYATCKDRFYYFTADIPDFMPRKQNKIVKSEVLCNTKMLNISVRFNYYIYDHLDIFLLTSTSIEYIEKIKFYVAMEWP